MSRPRCFAIRATLGSSKSSSLYGSTPTTSPSCNQSSAIRSKWLAEPSSTKFSVRVPAKPGGRGASSRRLNDVWKIGVVPRFRSGFSSYTSASNGTS